jgi:hypothetical protein
VLADLQNKQAGKLQVLGVTFTEDAAQQMPRFLAEIRPPFPVGMSGRGRVLEFLDVTIDDGRQLPNLVLIDPRGNVKSKLPWHDATFTDPAKEAGRIAAAIEELHRAPRKKS